MAPTTSRTLTPQESRFTQVLEVARQAARDSAGYCSTSSRLEMSDQCQAKFSYRPHTWQLDVSEAILLKLDAVLIAGTGSGKTTPFVLPLMVKQNEGKESILLLISPTKELQKDQVRSVSQRIYHDTDPIQASTFRKTGLSTAVVNEDTWTNQLGDVSLHSSNLSGTYLTYIIRKSPLPNIESLYAAPRWL
jgi:superfamily II DNA/RNA helicase